MPKKEIIKPTTKVDVFYLLFHIWYNGWPKKYIWYNDMISQINKKRNKTDILGAEVEEKYFI